MGLIAFERQQKEHQTCCVRTVHCIECTMMLTIS